MDKVLQRFEQKYNKLGLDECWIWTASLTSTGYGQFMFQGRPQGAHRISYMLYVGEIPKDMWVLHKCDNPLCVNANHLFLGTHYDNDMDREKKGRGKNGGNLGITIGEKHGGSKLKNEDILNIRKRNIRGKGGNTPLLALEFNVKSKTINDIVAYRTWKHLK